MDRIHTPFGFTSTTADVTAGIDLTGKRVSAKITASTAEPDVHVEPLDLADRWDGVQDILVHDAAVMALPALQRALEGRQMRFAVNYLEHFPLALGLHDALAQAGRVRQSPSALTRAAGAGHYAGGRGALG